MTFCAAFSATAAHIPSSSGGVARYFSKEALLGVGEERSIASISTREACPEVDTGGGIVSGERPLYRLVSRNPRFAQKRNKAESTIW
jgi:hypothetical protein